MTLETEKELSELATLINDFAKLQNFYQLIDKDKLKKSIEKQNIYSLKLHHFTCVISFHTILLFLNMILKSENKLLDFLTLLNDSKYFANNKVTSLLNKSSLLSLFLDESLQQLSTLYPDKSEQTICQEIRKNINPTQESFIATLIKIEELLNEN